jgi:hypothetical protein
MESKGKEAERLFRLADEKFSRSLERTPNSTLTLYDWAKMLHNLALRYVGNMDMDNLGGGPNPQKSSPSVPSGALSGSGSSTGAPNVMPLNNATGTASAAAAASPAAPIRKTPSLTIARRDSIVMQQSPFAEVAPSTHSPRLFFF